MKTLLIVSSCFLLLSGCKMSIDTSSNSPVTFGGEQSSNADEQSQNLEIQEMKDEISRLKSERNSKIEQLEAEISSLKKSEQVTEAKTDNALEKIKRVVEKYSYAAEFEDFEYAKVHQNLKNIGSVIAFKADKGTIIGDFIIDSDEYFMADHLANLSEACTKVYTSSPKDIDNRNMRVEEHNVLCLSSEGIQTVSTALIFYGNDAQFVLHELAFYQRTEKEILDTFYKVAENVRLFHSM